MSGKLFYEKSEDLGYLVYLLLLVFFFNRKLPFLMHLEAVLVNSPRDCGGHGRAARSPWRSGLGGSH